jgi:glycosyltransferase involved in cell wall biosynthesis
VSDLRVLHVITALYAGGGAETLLVRMLEELGEERRNHSVVTLRVRGTLAHRVEELGVPIDAIGMSRIPTPAALWRLARFLRRSDADVIQTWLLHSNVLAGIIARLVSRTPVVWGVHVSGVSRSVQGYTAVVLQRCEALCSYFVPARIIACSVSARRVMERLRYRRSRIVTVVNGFDLRQYRPDRAAREEVRRELGISPATVVVGHVARFHPMKDHRTLLAAAGQVLERASDVRFVLCGARVDADNPKFGELAAPLGDRVLALGLRGDMPRVLNAFDLAVQSSSDGEALPLAIGEAMATGLPLVTTRSGDAPEMIGESGAVTPIGDPAALAAALLELIEMDPEARAELGARARERISSEYSLRQMVDGYRRVWSEVA